MTVALENTSRFTNTPQTIVDGQETFGTWVRPSFLKIRPTSDQINKLYITAEFEGRPDIIATKVYGDPTLDWVILAFNRGHDVLNWPKAGDIIEYPIDSLVLPQLI